MANFTGRCVRLSLKQYHQITKYTSVDSDFSMLIIQSFVLAYCLLLSGFLLTRCWQSHAARHLLIALGILISIITLNYGLESGQISSMPAFRWALPIYLGPALYGLTSSLIRPLSKKNLYQHVLISCVPAFLVTFFPNLKSGLELSVDINAKQLGLGFSYLFLIYYLDLSFRLIRQYVHWLPQSIAASETLQLRWLSYFLSIIAALVAIELVEWFTPIIFQFSTPIFYLIEMLFLALALLMLTLEIFQRPEGLLMQIPSESSSKENLDPAIDNSYLIENAAKESDFTSPDRTPYQDANADLVSLLNDIDAQIVKKELYRIPNLSLTQLANEVALTPRELSYVINKVSGRNFSDFINSYRVKEVARTLSCENTKNINLLELSLEVGFNSKSTFNTMFKREFGCTPSEFRKKKLTINAKTSEKAD